MTSGYETPYIRGRLYWTDLTSGVTYTMDEYQMTYEWLSVTLTQRRIKPVDLFANGTSRVLVTQSVNAPYATWLTPGSRYYGPLSALVPLGDDGKLNSYPNVTTVLDSKLRAKIKHQNVNLAQAFAEYRQTSSMFARAAADVVKTFRSLRSGRAFGDFVRILQKPRTKSEKRIANRWLEYQYGVKPLLSDIYGSAEALATKIRTGMFLYQSVTHQDDFVQVVKVTGLSPYTSVKGILTRRHVYKAHARARYKVSDPALKQLSQIGITNPLLLVWEVIPYSFVIDWLFPVGNWLSSLDSLTGVTDLRVLRGYKSHKTWVYDIAGSSGSFSLRTVSRSAPTTTLAFPKLGYQPSASLTKVLNGLALLRQLRK